MLENLPPPAMKASLSLAKQRRMPRQPKAGLGKLGGQNGGKARAAKLSAIRFVLEAKDATILLAEGNQEKKRDFLKKIGSNFQVADKSLAVEFKNPWNLLADFNSDLSNTHARQRVKSKKSNWRCLLAKVRTFFEENPAVRSRSWALPASCSHSMSGARMPWPQLHSDVICGSKPRNVLPWKESAFRVRRRWWS